MQLKLVFHIQDSETDEIILEKAKDEVKKYIKHSTKSWCPYCS